MRSLLELQMFASLADNLRDCAESLQQVNSVNLLAPLSLEGIISLAHLESALLDSNIAYRRRFHPRTVSGATIEIGDGTARTAPVDPSLNPLHLRLVPITVRALRGHKGKSHTGTLSPVAQAAALAELLAGEGNTTRRLRPWLLAGNWLNAALDSSYDPIYSRLRDHLMEEGSIKVVSLPEINEPDLLELTELDEVRLASTQTAWDSLDAAGRAAALSVLAQPQIVHDSPSTGRLEELIWHRIMIDSKSPDLHSILNIIQSEWDGSVESASQAIDKLLLGFN